MNPSKEEVDRVVDSIESAVMRGTGLLPRDVRLLQGLADGEELQMLAKSFASYQMCKNRLARIRDILGADSTCQAIAMAVRRKIIE